MLKKNFYRIFICLTGFIWLQGCSVKKFIPEDEFLYTGADTKIEAADSIKGVKEVKGEVSRVLTPEPNTKILGMRPGLYFHYKAQRENPGFINKFFNDKIGEEPVYLSDVDLEETRDIINNRLENRGFFFSEVMGETRIDSSAKKAQAYYEIELMAPIRVENFEMEIDNMPLAGEIENSLSESIIKEGMRFDLVALKAERERIDRHLKREGYYNFNPTFLIFEADTNRYENKKFNLFLDLKKDVPQEAKVPYVIEQVNIHPNYTVGMDSIAKDTIRFENKNFIQETEFFKPKRLEPYILIEEGEKYSSENSRSTSRRLGSIGAYKFVNIRYDEIDSLDNDSVGKLEANIFLSPLKKRSLRAELQGVTKSNNFAGPGLALTFTNRNLFHGGEILNITANVSYERQIAGGDQAGLSSTQFGIENDLIFPRLIFPVSFDKNFFKYAIPKTKISLGGNYLNRTDLFSLVSASGRFGYYWNANRYITHELNPISVNYVQLANTTEEFEALLDENPFLQSSFNQEFIAGLTYSFTYNGMVDEYKTHQFFINSTLDLAGNSIDLISGDEERPQKFLGLEYAQYSKADVDLRYHWRLGSDQKIATRIFAGLGLAYGNSEVLPFAKQYFSGGPYSVRAFRIRSLGPGTYSPEGPRGRSFFDQSGNVRLEANAEYRFPIVAFLKGAAFVDAGNVWNTRENETLPGGKFESDFMNELGIGGGAGLRVDIQSFVIRFDLAFPFHDPRLEEGERWSFDFADPVLNFAIGYPF